jgi:hypothetical protein
MGAATAAKPEIPDGLAQLGLQAMQFWDGVTRRDTRKDNKPNQTFAKLAEE